MSNESTLRMRESTYRRDGGPKTRGDGASSHEMTVQRNLRVQDHIQTKLVLRKHISKNRKAVSNALRPRIPSRQSVPMHMGKVEVQVIEQASPETPGVSNFNTRQTPEIFFARSLEPDSEDEGMYGD